MNDIAPGSNGVPAVSPAATDAGAPASPADVNGNGSVAPSPSASPVIDWKTAPEQLRTQYETTKQEADRLRAEQEQWSKLGDRESVAKVYQNYTQNLNKTVEIGKALGYTEESLRRAYEADPVGTLRLVQQEYAKPPEQPLSREEMDRLVNQRVTEKVTPIQERYEQTVNSEAEQRYEAERDRLYKAEFPEGLPDRAKTRLFKELDEAISSDPEALSRLKFSKQVSDVAKHFTAVKTEFLQFQNELVGHQRGQNNGNPQVKPGETPRAENGRFADRKISAKFGGGTVGDLIKNL